MAKSSDPIYDALRNEIIMLVIKPGTMLREIDIAERFNVSRTPVRDVFVRLERDNLVEVVSQKGTYVTRVNIDAISEVMYIRQTIETSVISDLIDKITPDQVNVLSMILLEQKEILQFTNTLERNKRFFENDNRFHSNCFAFVGRLGVWNIINNLSPTYNRYRNVTYLRKQDRLQELFRFHVLLLENIKKRDKVAALATLSDHFYSGLSGIEDVFTTYRDYFI